MQPFWRITLLDGLTLSPAWEPNGANAERAGAGEMRRFRSQKAAALLAYLALHVGRDCSRDVLCEALWPDGEEMITRNRLRVTLSSLRHQMEPPGVPKGAVLDVSVVNVVRLRAESVWVDVAAFEKALQSGDTQTARALFKGELLPTFYDEWILQERERLNASAQNLFEKPDNSPILPVFEETNDAVPPTPRHRLPLYLTRFFGRDAERKRIRELLTEGQCRLITLTGAGGQGKTRLGIEAAREQTRRPVWFVPLADLWEGGRLGETIRDALDLPRSSAPALPQVVSFLQAQALPLLLLDNMEQIAPFAAPVLTALLHQVPDLTMIVTSRVRMEIPGEQEIPVYPLPTPASPMTDLTTSARLPSVALFVDRAQSARPDFQLTERNAPDIAGICQLLDGIPLGLELAAARAASFTPFQIRQKLADHWNALPAVGKTEKTSRHRSLRAAIEWSVALLPSDQRQLFTHLSVFQGGAALDAIEAVCYSPNTLDTLTRLRASSLVLLTEHGNRFRILLLDVLRQWASEQQSPLEKNALAARHFAWFYRFASDRKVLFPHLSGVTALEEMEAEIANFRAALLYSRTENPSGYLDLVSALIPFWEHKSHFQEAQKWLEGALLLLPDTDGEPEKRLTILLGLGTIAGRQGDGDAALHWLREAQNSPTPIPAPVRAALHWATGRAFWIKGALMEALEQFEESKRLYLVQNDYAGLASTLSNIGVTLRDQGDYEGARTAFTEAIQLAREHDVPRTLATVLDNFAGLRHILNEDSVPELYRESLALKRALQMPDGVAVTLSNLAMLHCRKQEWAEGRRLSEEVSVLFRAMGNRRGLAITINRLGQIADVEGKHDEAKRHFVESLTLRLALGNPHGIIVALIGFSEHALSVKNPRKAAQILGVVQKHLEEWGTPLPVDEDAEYQQHCALVQAALPPAAFKHAIREGASWTQADLLQKLQR